MTERPIFQELDANSDVLATTHGARAQRLVELRGLNLPVPKAFALPLSALHAISAGTLPDIKALLAGFGDRAIVSVRSSPHHREWGGPPSVLNVGLNDQIFRKLTHRLGADAATTLYCRFIQNFSLQVAHLDPEAFEEVADTDLDGARQLFERETGDEFPQNPTEQLGQVLRSMARGWEGTSARILRAAKGAPDEAGLGLIVQRMALGLGAGESGAGLMQFVSPATGVRQISGRYLSQSQGRDAVSGERPAVFLSKDARGPSLEDISPDAYAAMTAHGETARMGCHDALRLEFTIENGREWLLDAAPAERSPRAAVRIAVDLANDGAISRSDALLRVEPRNLTELLHPQIDPTAPRDVFAQGIGASPGAATGRIVFSATAAQASAAREEPCILVRTETSPEDIRGMHAANGVLTERGGMTSHAAVIARGLGLPCVVGAAGIKLDFSARTLTTTDGQVFREGLVITVDGTTGEALKGTIEMMEPELDGAFEDLMSWADEVRDLSVRANADTPADARMARTFMVDGIGLCRTEHMFFEEDRLTVMREMIFADDQAERAAALDRLLPMQRSDFVEMFNIMHGLPVCIRLFDPPLHEFLPHARDEMQDLADVMNLPVSQVVARAADLAEFNPMLGMRGVRLGITEPQIYEMQARAIFEATVLVNRAGSSMVPEIMVPLVSAHREVELVKARVEAVAAAVQKEQSVSLEYRLGVMVETPRAALRAGDLAASSEFLSFGTNDLTQMTYGLSRDDAGRFMSTYVNQRVFPEDPFQTLDLEGIGELMLMAAKRGRATNSNVVLAMCGEHGGDPASIAFCKFAGFDYVSCSPFRVPVARLAAAHAAILGDKSHKA